MASTASAAEPNGWYAAWDIGAHWDRSIPAVSQFTKPDGTNAKWRFKTKTDWDGFARLGYRFDPNWRAELEFGYRDGRIQQIKGNLSSGNAGEPLRVCGVGSAAGACDSPKGYLNNLTAMANVIYDFFPESSFHPFIGAGVGVDDLRTHTSGKFITPTGSAFASPEAFNGHSGSTHFAWQLLAGDTFDLSSQWAMDVTYRYLRSNQRFASTEDAGGVTLGNFSRHMTDHSVSIGLRYMFAPPPAYQAKDFTVYFPFDKYVLTPEATTVVQEAANYATMGNATSLVIVGHTDTSGSDGYNQRLSERRAKAVADELGTLGIPLSKLSVSGTGEKDLAKPTPDGVKEPLNRRATIGINF